MVSIINNHHDYGVGCRGATLRMLVMLAIINASGRYINLTNYLQFLERTGHPHTNKTYHWKRFQVLLRDGYIKKLNKKKNHRERQHYVLTAQAITILDKITKSIEKGMERIYSY